MRFVEELDLPTIYGLPPRERLEFSLMMRKAFRIEHDFPLDHNDDQVLKLMLKSPPCIHWGSVVINFTRVIPSGDDRVVRTRRFEKKYDITINRTLPTERRRSYAELVIKHINWMNEGMPEEVPIPEDTEGSPECVVCMLHKIRRMIKPCNHACLCHGCAKKVEVCPICRGPVRETEKIFIP